MAKRQASNILLTAFVTLVITVLIGGFIVAYLASSEPVFYLEESNNYGFNKDKEETLYLNLYNKGDVPGLATLCIYSREFVFVSDTGDFIHQICYNRIKINPKQTDLMTTFQPKVKPDANIFNTIENGTIRIDVTCSQKIWSLLPKDCDSVTKIYKYKKDGDRFNKIT